MVFLLVAGIGFLLAGLASIIFGVPVKEFSFGNTLILSGVAGGCTGAILLGLHVVVREIRAMAAVASAATQQPPAKPRPVFPPQASAGEADSKDGQLFPGDRSEPDLETSSAGSAAAGPGSSPPWQDEAATRDRLRPRGSEAAVLPPPPAESNTKKRNLLFSSSSRKERERAAAKSGDPIEPEGTAPEPASSAPAIPPRTFEEAWPESDRPRGDSGARRGRSLFGGGDAREPAPAEPERPKSPERTPAPRSEETTEVTVLKSGVVDGMAYSLYSDGSIEAQMPEGMMRFASIDELRDHLDQRT